MQKKTLRPFLSVSIFVVFLTLFIISNLSIVKAQTQTPLQTYKDPQGRFTIQYPSSTWEIAPRESAFPYYGTATAIAFKPTSEGNDPTSHSVFSITPTDAEKSLDKVTLQVKPKSLDQIVSDTINFLKTPSSVLGDMQVEVLKNNQTAIGGFPAREVTYLTHSIGTFDMQAFVVNGDKLYTFVFSTPELQVPQTFPAVQKMLQSVKFGTPAASTTTTPLPAQTTASGAVVNNSQPSSLPPPIFNQSPLFNSTTTMPSSNATSLMDILSNRLAEAADPNLIALQGNASIQQCTPYSEHQNDNFTFNGKDAITTQTCYNALAHIVFSCNTYPIQHGNPICSDRRVIDFGKNYYDPAARPYDRTAWKIVTEKNN